MIKFKTGTFVRSLIEKVEVERETDSFVWINNRRVGKNTGYDQFWDSWEDALHFLLSRANDRVLRAKKRLAEENEELGKILNLTPID